MNADQFTLLVVDDNEMNRDLLSRRLEKKGYQVRVAADGLHALELVGKGGIDLVLLDIMMPGMDGIEVLRALREHYTASELPVIMVSAKDESEDVVEALELGANDYVTKPIDFPIVLARLQSQLRMRETAKARDAAAQVDTTTAPGEIGPDTVIAAKYLIEQKLGSGSFGAVYKARHISLDSPVAIKILQGSVVSSAEALVRFQREGISACRIKHPNAVSVIDFGVTPNGVAYLAMELLEGVSLGDELDQKGPMSVKRVGEILVPICAVLAEAHAAGIIHRDIKPPNIFLHVERGREVVKVLDFGIAKLVGESGSHMTMEGSLLGTPAYMAPERLTARPYDGRADVYGVGIMAYQMLAGRPPFIGPDPMAIAMQHVNTAPPALTTLAPGVPVAVEAVVMQALVKDPEERPTAAQFADMFARAAAGAGATPPAAPVVAADEFPTLASSDFTMPVTPKRQD